MKEEGKKKEIAKKEEKSEEVRIVSASCCSSCIQHCHIDFSDGTLRGFRFGDGRLANRFQRTSVLVSTKQESDRRCSFKLKCLCCA